MLCIRIELTLIGQVKVYLEKYGFLQSSVFRVNKVYSVLVVSKLTIPSSVGTRAMCMCACKQFPGNQSFDRQIAALKKGGDVRKVGQWIWTGNCLQVCYMILIGVRLTMHLVDPSYCHNYNIITCVRTCARARVCVCMCVCAYVSLHVKTHIYWNNRA